MREAEPEMSVGGGDAHRPMPHCGTRYAARRSTDPATVKGSGPFGDANTKLLIPKRLHYEPKR